MVVADSGDNKQQKTTKGGRGGKKEHLVYHTFAARRHTPADLSAHH